MDQTEQDLQGRQAEVSVPQDAVKVTLNGVTIGTLWGAIHWWQDIDEIKLGSEEDKVVRNFFNRLRDEFNFGNTEDVDHDMTFLVGGKELTAVGRLMLHGEEQTKTERKKGFFSGDAWGHVMASYIEAGGKVDKDLQEVSQRMHVHTD